MKSITKIISIAALVVGIVSCNTEVPLTVGGAAENVEVGFALPMSGTRTAIDSDGMTTRWAPGDKITVWAKSESGDYVVDNAIFSLRNFTDSYDKAIFSGNISAMAEGNYSYLLSYPTPTKVIGTLATYNVSNVQSGEYDGKYDIMIADPVTAGSLTTGAPVTLNTTMRHKMHAIKITIPEGRNIFGSRFYRLEITFPTNVVGDVTFDISDLSEAPIYSNMSNVITVESAEGFDAGDDIWVFVLPGTVDGNVSYNVASDTQRSVTNAYSLSRTLAAGHVTPIRMATPELYRYTSFVLSEGGNNLGEDFNSFQVYDKNNSLLASFVRNAENVYEFGFEGNLDFTPWENSDLRLVFDTENTIVEAKVRIGAINHSHKNTLTPFIVPYLFEEDFSTFPSVSSNDTYGTSSSGGKSAVELKSGSGWTGARCGVQAGTAARIAARRETSADYPARIDAAPLSSIKSGKTVNIKVSYNYGASQEAGGISPVRLGQTILQGYVTTQGGIGSEGSIWESMLITGSQNFSLIEGVYSTGDYLSISADENSGSYTNLPYSATYSLNGVGNNVRLSWSSVGLHQTGANNNTFWFYIDNVKVQIVE